MFKFKGKSNIEMGIICEEEDNLIAKSSQKIERIEIEGRDGALYNALGYSDIDRNIKLYVRDVSKLDEIIAWLNGDGIIEYKGRISKARFYDIIDPKRSGNLKIMECSLIREPFWYKANDDYSLIENNNIINEGNVYSKPIIRIEKNNDNIIDLTINNIRFVYTFDDTDYVEIDFEEMNAYSDGIIKNRNLEIGFDMPIIYPGNNAFSVNSGDATIKIKRKDCWL